jgi:hypothetical protein
MTTHLFAALVVLVALVVLRQPGIQADEPEE